MYLDDLGTVIRRHVPVDRLPDGDLVSLFRLYAVLLRAKGADVSQSDVHDAWAAWMSEQEAHHPSLVRYEDLPEDVRHEDRIFATAIRSAADQLDNASPSRPKFMEVLFPSGPPATESELAQALDLYKIMVESSEELVSRRQGANTFFLTINGALLTASTLIVQTFDGNKLGALGIAVLAGAGAILCATWRSLITSFGQLNRGKFQVINTIERYLKAAIYAAEWEALGRGEDPKLYRSFTSREIWVPTVLFTIYISAGVIALLVASEILTLG